MSTSVRSPNIPRSTFREAAARQSMRRFLLIPLGVCALLWSSAVHLQAGGVVSGCSQQDLENAVAGGGDVTFSRDCEITLTNPVRLVLNTRLDAAGYNVTIKSLLNALNSSITNIAATTNVTATPIGTNCQTTIGCVTNDFFEVFCTTNVACTTNYSFTTNITFTTNIISSTTFTNGARLFEVASNASVSFTSLRLVRGRSTNGGALFVATSASAFLTNCVFTNNFALGSNGLAGVDRPDEPTNGKDGGAGGSGQSAQGGAICNLGSLTVVDCVFQSNHATGGNGGRGGRGGNGEFNGGNGGSGGSGGSGLGGAIYSSGPVSLVDCSFEGNTVTGGSGGIGGTNGVGAFPGLKGIGGAGAPASGVGLYSLQTATVVNCTFANNIGEGGDSAAGGTQSNGNGSSGARGGDSFGGGIYHLGANGVLTNCTFFGNQVIAGNGGDGGNGDFNAGNGGNGGDGRGGGLYNAGAMDLVNCTFSNGSARGGTNGLAGSAAFPGSNGQMGASRGGNLANFGPWLWLKNSIVATNLSGGGGYGSLTDAGNNISADNSLVFGGNSLGNTDPKLGPLADNGGPTKTMSLLPGSPAIDAGDDAAGPNFDQRGFVRPTGARSDIGAVETGSLGITTQPQSQTRNLGGSVTFGVMASGDAALAYQWRFHGTNLPGAAGTSLTINNLTTDHAGPYQVVVTNNFGALTSAVATLTIITSPAITTQPANLSVLLGQTAAFGVAATGLPPLSYQWRFNGADIPDATANAYSRANVQVADDGSFTVVITNASGSVTSQPAVLKVLLNPALTQVRGTQTNFSFTFLTTTGLTYVVEYKNDLNALTWTPLATNGGTGNILTYMEGVTNLFSRFYRVVAR